MPPRSQSRSQRSHIHNDRSRTSDATLELHEPYSLDAKLFAEPYPNRSGLFIPTLIMYKLHYLGQNRGWQLVSLPTFLLWLSYCYVICGGVCMCVCACAAGRRHWGHPWTCAPVDCYSGQSNCRSRFQGVNLRQRSLSNTACLAPRCVSSSHTNPWAFRLHWLVCAARQLCLRARRNCAVRSERCSTTCIPHHPSPGQVSRTGR